MTAVARIGDIVVGYCDGPGHDAHREFVGTWINGSETVCAEGVGVVRVGDTGQTDCGHTFIAASGSDKASADGCALHRVGDTVIVNEGGVGVTQTGSDNSFAGE